MWLPSDIVTARANLWKAQERFRSFPRLNVEVNGFEFSMHRPELGWESRKDPYLGCFLDDEALARVLRRESHWNNLEIGCHILFDRRPNIYMPDVHTLMSFFCA